MSKLAIQGHAARGKEVIEILKMFGGTNKENCWGVFDTRLYIINDSGDIEDISLSDKSNYQIHTLEEFLKKFPYKVGDRVIWKLDKDKKQRTIARMSWDGNRGVVYWLNCKGSSFGWCDVNELEPYKEKTMDKAVFDANAQCCDIMNQLIKKETMEGKITMNEDKGTLVAIDLTRELKKADEIEVMLGDYEFVLKNGKTYFVKKNKYPKTYEECCKTLHIPVNGDIVYAGNWVYGGEYLDKHLDIIRNFQKLLICRDAYWKIAGDWNPNWKNYDVTKYCISTDKNVIGKCNRTTGNKILAFPTTEIRDAFYENFKNLIEQCKELL